MTFSTILASTRNLVRFSFLRPNIGDNSLLTIKDHNNLVSQLNNVFPYRSYDIGITQTALIAPTFTKLAAGASECKNNCDCTGPYECECDFPCGKNPNAALDFVYNGVGDYTLTITLDPAEYTRGIRNVGVYFTPFKTVTHAVTVDVIPSTTLGIVAIDIKTYIGGILTNGVFANTPAAIKIYFNKS